MIVIIKSIYNTKKSLHRAFLEYFITWKFHLLIYLYHIQPKLPITLPDLPNISCS